MEQDLPIGDLVQVEDEAVAVGGEWVDSQPVQVATAFVRAAGRLCRIGSAFRAHR